jgi:hypothetical protein
MAALPAGAWGEMLAAMYLKLIRPLPDKEPEQQLGPVAAHAALGEAQLGCVSYSVVDQETMGHTYQGTLPPCSGRHPPTHTHIRQAAVATTHVAYRKY